MLRVAFKNNEWRTVPPTRSDPLAEAIRSGLMKGIEQGLPALAEDLAFKLARVRVQDVAQILARGDEWRRMVELAAVAIARPDLTWQLWDAHMGGRVGTHRRKRP